MFPRRSVPPVVGPIAPGALLRAAFSYRSENVISHAISSIERRYSGYHAYLSRSGTTALEVAIRAVRHSSDADDRNSKTASASCAIALPAWCCPDVATAAIGARAPIALYDLDPYTLTPDYASLELTLQRGARTIVLAHFFGRISDPSPCLELASRYGATVIEDAAQGAGASNGGALSIPQAPLAILSFGRGKGRHAGGGGAVLSVQPLPGPTTEVVAHVREIGVLLRAVAVSLLAHPLAFGLARTLPLGLGETYFTEPSPERQISRIVAALVPFAIDREEQDANQRQESSRVWRQLLAEFPNAMLRGGRADERDGALRFPILADPKCMSSLQPYGVYRGYPLTLDRYPEVIPHLVSGHGDLPGARELAERLHTLPNHAYVTTADRYRIVRALAD